MIIMSFVEMMVGTAQNIINYLLLLLYIVNCSKFIWFFDLIWFDLVITTLLLEMVLHWHCVHQIMCVVVIFDLLVATSEINPRVPGFESTFTGSPILTVKARTFDFSDSLSSSSMMTLTISLKVKADFVCFCFLPNIFPAFLVFLFKWVWCHLLSLLCWMLVVVLRGFLFFKRWVLEPLSPSRWFWFYMTLLWQGCHSNDIQK